MCFRRAPKWSGKVRLISTDRSVHQKLTSRFHVDAFAVAASDQLHWAQVLDIQNCPQGFGSRSRKGRFRIGLAGLSPRIGMEKGSMPSGEFYCATLWSPTGTADWKFFNQNLSPLTWPASSSRLRIQNAVIGRAVTRLHFAAHHLTDRLEKCGKFSRVFRQQKIAFSQVVNY